MSKPFWQAKTLEQMSSEEWESICDGCARCCLHKLEDEDTSEVHYTRVVCRYLDQQQCACSDYQNRSINVPDCVRLTPENLPSFNWLPDSCGYKRLSQGKDLLWWHPLVSGSPHTVHQAGISVRNRCVSEVHVHPEEWQDHLIDWVEL